MNHDRYLFRAKRTDNGEWETWNAIGGIQLGISIDGTTICQCTGVKDKKGKLIWENDIVECIFGEEHFLSQVEWDDECAGFIYQDSEEGSWVGMESISEADYYCEVLGNIWDKFMAKKNDGGKM